MHGPKRWQPPYPWQLSPTASAYATGSPHLQTRPTRPITPRAQAAWSGGKVYTVEEAAGSDAARTPSLVWSVTQPSLALSAAAPGCAVPAGWGAGFDYSQNRSAEFGASTQAAWEAFVKKAAEASHLLDQARYYWASRRPRAPAAAAPEAAAAAAALDGAEAKAADDDLSAALLADPALAMQMNRSDVSPFMIPSADVPRHDGAGGVHAATGKGYSSYPCARGNKRCTFYGNVYGHSGYSRWNCWTCGYGTNGFYVKSK
mgnify:CR=1 FL=1